MDAKRAELIRRLGVRKWRTASDGRHGLEALCDDVYRRIHHVREVLVRHGLSLGEHPNGRCRVLVADHRGPLEDILVAIVPSTPDYLQDIEDLVETWRLVSAFESLGLEVVAIPVNAEPPFTYDEVVLLRHGETVDAEEGAPGMLVALRALQGRWVSRVTEGMVVGEG